MEDIDVWRTAKLLIDQHGEDAPIIVAQRIDALMAKGDLDGRIAWRRVKFAIERLMAYTRREGDTLH
jgi:hypothetical protein